MNSSQRESARQKDANSRRVLDEAARRRRARKALEALEQDNFHDDPHANLGIFVSWLVFRSFINSGYLCSSKQKDP
jgi:zinc finger HIT domain-containing protein 1